MLISASIILSKVYILLSGPKRIPVGQRDQTSLHRRYSIDLRRACGFGRKEAERLLLPGD